MQLAARDQHPVCECVLPGPDLVYVGMDYRRYCCDVLIDVVKGALDREYEIKDEPESV